MRQSKHAITFLRSHYKSLLKHALWLGLAPLVCCVLFSNNALAASQTHTSEEVLQLLEQNGDVKIVGDLGADDYFKIPFFNDKVSLSFFKRRFFQEFFGCP